MKTQSRTPKKPADNGKASGVRIIGFKHEVEIVDRFGRTVEKEAKFNRIPQDALSFLIRAPFGDTPPIASFYCGLYTNNYVPTDSTSSADIPSVMGEFTAYSESARPIWDKTFIPFNQYTNNDDLAEYTPTSDGVVYGAFLSSSATKGSGTGLLLSAARFNTAKTLTVGNKARHRVSLVYLPTDVI